MPIFMYYFLADVFPFGARRRELAGQRRIEALREMAKRGTPHESATAKAILEKLNIEVNQEEPTEDFVLKWDGDYERSLLMQTIGMVLDTTDTPVYGLKGKSTKRWVRCTKSQYIELDLFWTAYRRSLREELEITVHAFIQKNRIFPSEIINAEPKPLTDEQRRVLERMDSVGSVAVRKQIAKEAV